MTSPIPVNPGNKSTGYTREPNSFSSFGDLYQFYQPKHLKVSRVSPPVVNKDVTEGELILDKTLLRIYTVVDGTLRYFQLT